MPTFLSRLGYKIVTEAAAEVVHTRPGPLQALQVLAYSRPTCHQRQLQQKRL